MTLRDVWPALGVPVAGFVIGVYHKYLIHPLAKRVDILETKTNEQAETLARIDERTEWIKDILDKKYNGKR